MIAAVDSSSDRFGGLEGYLARSVRPSGVPRRPPDFANGAGAKTRPSADVPTPAQPFKTSGATPGKKSNECIPYARKLCDSNQHTPHTDYSLLDAVCSSLFLSAASGKSNCQEIGQTGRSIRRISSFGSLTPIFWFSVAICGKRFFESQHLRTSSVLLWSYMALAMRWPTCHTVP